MAHAKQKIEKMFTALSALETELIGLKDVVSIMDKIPMEHPRPVYLVRRIAFHTDELGKKFNRVWRVHCKEADNSI